MSTRFFYHFLLISQFELKGLFFTRKGLLYLMTVGVVWYFILFYPIRFAADFLNQKQNISFSSGFFDFIGFGSILNWQIPEMGVYWHFSLIIFPLLTVMTSADQTCSDRERGSIRFLCLRVSRDSLFFGRFAGVMFTQSLFILVTLLSTVALAVYRDAGLLSVAVNSAVVILINLFIVLLPFTAMMAILSATVKSARQATVWAILVWTLLAGFISLLSSYLPALDMFKTLVPGYQMAALSQLAEWQTFQQIYIPLFQSVVLLSIGRWVMHRQNL